MPVWAIPITSLPESMGLKVFCWIKVGSKRLRSASASKILSESPKSAKVVTISNKKNMGKDSFFLFSCAGEVIYGRDK